MMPEGKIIAGAGTVEGGTIYTAFVTPTKYRCTKGHAWEKKLEDWNPNQFDFSLLMPVGGLQSIKGLCPFCLMDKLNELLADVGRVEQVK